MNNGLPLLARRLHKWIALVVGVQASVWTLSGFYMVAIDLDFIHGDHLIREEAPRSLETVALGDPLLAARAVPGATGVRLHRVLGRDVYIAAAPQGDVALDARNLERLPRPTDADIRRIAQQRFNGSEPIVGVELLNEVPFEIRGRRAPLWRVQFEGWNNPTLYFSASTGELLTRRHELWRVFDFLFGLHIMDYSERENPNNLLIRVFSWGALTLTLTGAWLLFYSFPRRKRRRSVA
ncbi:MAG: hypothetical protein ACK4SZ_14080 [Allosphingosinicella sp.]|uniref:hypothetical protein n=1 Tax=Allosphingosinicella sp. TaxID=2823234 RepID=UPI003928D376